MLKRILLSLIITAVTTGMAIGEVAITVYNQNLGLVRDRRTLEFEDGTFELNFTSIPSAIDPTSVHFKLLDDPDAAVILEQNYRYDLVSAAKILEKFIDNDIEITAVAGDQTKFYSGQLLAFDGENITLMTDGGGVKVIESKWISDISFTELPEGLITRPTLVWKLASDVSGQRDAEVSYLTRQMSWEAQYVAVVAEDDKSIDLSGWVSITNRAGATFEDATLKLIAGDVNVVQPSPPSFRRGGMETQLMAKADAGFEEKAFFEYHLYTLPRKTTLSNNEIKQISLFEPATTPAEKVFVYEGQRYGKDVRINMEFTNSEEAGLGMPLPAGKVRVMKRDSDGLLEFIGEDLIDHTPRDEDLRLYVGNAFDVVGERTVVNRRQITDRMNEQEIKIELRNHKDENITVKVVERFGPYWEIEKTSIEFEKEDASTAIFRVPVAADSDTTLTYTVRTWY